MRNWFRRKRDEDLEAEIQAHLAMAARDRIERGESAETAKERAQREFGNRTSVKEITRGMWVWSSLEPLWQDLRYASRTLGRSIAFTAVAILSLSIGIGVNTAVFSVLDALLVKSLPVSHPEQLRILTWIRGKGGEQIGLKDHSGYGMTDDNGRHIDGSFSYPAYTLLRDTLPQFSDLVAFARSEFTVTGNGTTDIVSGQYVSGNYFTGLGAQPLVGRPILAGDRRTAVLSARYWSKRFDSDPGVVGRVILVNRLPVTVVGIMKPSFQGLWPGSAPDLFVPMAMVPETSVYFSLARNDTWWVQIFGELRPGFSDTAASAAVQAALTHQIQSYTGKKDAHIDIALEPGERGIGYLRSSLRTPLYILAASAILVVLIACVNLASLLLARYAARNREIAVRISIGAGRWRLIRQLMTESLLLGGIGALGGLLIARPILRVLLQFLSGRQELGLDARLDLRMLAFTFALAILTALLFGTLPSWRASILAPNRTLRLSVGRYLVSIQMALSLLLLVGTGLFLRTIFNLASVNLGFQSDNILLFQTDPGKTGYKASQMESVRRGLEARLAAIPGVESVGMAHQALITGYVSNGPVRLPGDPNDKETWFLYCDSSFLQTLRIPILLGGLDIDRNVRSAVVNETFVKKYLPNVNPIGQVFYRWDTDYPTTIAGVVKDAHYQGVRDQAPPTAYIPYALRYSGITEMTFAMRTQLPPMSLAATVRKAVASVDPSLPVDKMQTQRDQIDTSLGQERMFATLITAFGGVALALAAVGLYGVMAFAVNRRTPEIGIRMALGAGRANVQWLVLRQGLLLVCMGAVIGVPAALMLTRLVKSMLFGVQPNDAFSIAGAVIVMCGVGAIAGWIPARRASSVDPMVVLRYE